MARPAVGVVIQARMSSVRLPGKVLRPLRGRPMLAYLLEGVAKADVDSVVVATSIEPDDDELATWCERQGLRVHRGPLSDVASRFAAAADGLDAAVRLSGDSPLLDHRLVSEGVAQWRALRPDLVTNVFPRSFPHGQSVEVIRVQALAEAVPRMREERHREHITTWFYDHAEEYDIVPIVHDRDLSGVQMAVDQPTDLARMEAMLGALVGSHCAYGFEELAALLDGV